MGHFGKPQKRIWKEIKREFLRREEKIRDGVYDIFNVYAVHYQDIALGGFKIEEKFEISLIYGKIKHDRR